MFHEGFFCFFVMFQVSFQTPFELIGCAYVKNWRIFLRINKYTSSSHHDVDSRFIRNFIKAIIRFESIINNP